MSSHFLSGESDIFVGRRSRLTRYLVIAMEGFFPVLARTGPDALAVIYRTGATHVGISGTLAVATSADGGKSWSDPVQIAPRWEDNRNPAFGVNGNGELIAAWWKAALHNYREDEHGNLLYEGEQKDAWASVPALFISKSADNGNTWSAEKSYKSELLTLASPYGRIIQAPDGTLLMSVYGTPRQPIEGVRDQVILLRSTDGGETWGDESLVATSHNETSFAFLPDGRLLAAARSEAGGHVSMLHSDDLGRSWSEPVQITRDGEHPADLTVLQSGKVLLTFGRRIRPMGCGLLLSRDDGNSWDTNREVLLAGDGIESGDLGYPSTVQLEDGHLVTVLYYASGSEMTAGFLNAWGQVSCQAIHYREEDIV
ncbi:MAG: sialidase family protein [Armatimonadota bacterium]